MNVEKITDTLLYWLSTYSLKLVAAILVLIIGKWLARKITNVTKKLLEKQNIDVTLVNFLDNIIYYTQTHFF